MNENRNQDRHPKHQAVAKHPDEWPEGLPNHLAGQSVGRAGLTTLQPPVRHSTCGGRVGTRREFTATGDNVAVTGHAYAPKDRVPYELWNRLIGEEKPGQRGGRE